ncbi:MAG: redoxin domain-containing protein [Candidatus Heimdallarchaeota archaeon]
MNEMQKILGKTMSKLSVGSKAPDFILLRSPGKQITLSEELKKGPVVLVFYPADFTSVCQTELCQFRDDLADYNDLGASILGISVDSIFSHAAFAKAHKIQFPLLSDWEKTTIRDYDVVFPDLAGMTNVAKRSVFVIDQEGLIQYVWVSEHPGNLPPFDAIKNAVERLN